VKQLSSIAENDEKAKNKNVQNKRTDRKMSLASTHSAHDGDNEEEEEENIFAVVEMTNMNESKSNNIDDKYVEDNSAVEERNITWCFKMKSCMEKCLTVHYWCNMGVSVGNNVQTTALFMIGSLVPFFIVQQKLVQL
jgi:hypothetical protein